MILSRLIIILPSVEYVHCMSVDLTQKCRWIFGSKKLKGKAFTIFRASITLCIFSCFQNKDFRDVGLQKVISLWPDFLWKRVTAWRVVTTFCGEVMFSKGWFVANFLIEKKKKKSILTIKCFTTIWLCKFVKNYKLAYCVLAIGFKRRASCDRLFILAAESTFISHLCPERWWMLCPWKQDRALSPWWSCRCPCSLQGN